MQEKKTINIEIGQRIKRQREGAGLTQEAFAEMIGLGVKHVSAIERGAVGVSIPTVQTICHVLSIPSDAILLDIKPTNDVGALAARLERLPQKQYKIVEKVVNSLFEAFATES